MSGLAANNQEDALAGVKALQARAERHYTPCGDGRMVWHAWGHGRSVVLLHGGAGSWRHWVRTVPFLSERCRVLAADMPGLGESDLPSSPWSPMLSADIIASGIEQLLAPDEVFDLVGFSAGSILSGLVAARLKGRCRILVLVGASALGTARNPIVLEKVRDKQGEARRLAHFTNLSRLMIADPARIDEQALAIQEWNSVHSRVNSVGFAESGLLRDALTESTAVIKGIWGAEDAPAGDSLAQRCAVLRSLRPNADIRVIPHAGHWVAYEAADIFNDTLVAMLDGAG